jgi:predicted TPR repeat methyltransferase
MLHKRTQWYADWRDHNSHKGKRHRKGFTSKKAAAAYEKRMKKEQEDKPRPKSRRMKSLRRGRTPRAASRRATTQRPS